MHRGVGVDELTRASRAMTGVAGRSSRVRRAGKTIRGATMPAAGVAAGGADNVTRVCICTLLSVCRLAGLIDASVQSL